MKKFLFPILIIIIFFINEYGTDKDIFLTLPIRVFSHDNKPIEYLSKKDFNLFVNQRQREIVKVFKINRSLNQLNGYQEHIQVDEMQGSSQQGKDTLYYTIKIEPPRNFILSFNISDYWNQIRDGISFFITNILKDGDTLIIQTPLKFYRIAVRKDKEILIDDIQKLVKKDTFIYKNRLNINRKNISRLINNFKRQGTGESISTMGKSPNEISNFLKNYLREFNIYKNKYILPFLLNIDKAIPLLAREEGAKWIINFQEREVIPYISPFRNIADEIKDFASQISGSDNAKATMLYTTLNRVEKSFLISERFSSQKILDALLGVNISYNVVLLKNQTKNIEFGDTISPDFENIFKIIAPPTGGITLYNSNLPESLGIISNFSDTHYHLIFKFNGKIEKKAIKVKLLNKNTLQYYKQLFNLEEIKFIVTESKKPKVKINNVSVKGHTLKFSISGFEQEVKDKKKYGLLKILIELINQKDSIVYESQNTLESHKKTISISLNLPSKYKGNFKIRISAFDNLAKKSSHVVRYTRL